MKKLLVIFMIITLVFTLFGCTKLAENSGFLKKHTISGNMYDPLTKSDLSNVKLTFEVPEDAKGILLDKNFGVVETDENGNWSKNVFGKVIVKPVSEDYKFTPPTREVNVTENKENLNFSALPNSAYDISGVVREANTNTPLNNVTISFETDEYASNPFSSITTDNNGEFNTTLDGEVTVIPQHDEFSFEPESLTVSSEDTNNLEFVVGDRHTLLANIDDYEDFKEDDGNTWLGPLQIAPSGNISSYELTNDAITGDQSLKVVPNSGNFRALFDIPVIPENFSANSANNGFKLTFDVKFPSQSDAENVGNVRVREYDLDGNWNYFIWEKDINETGVYTFQGVTDYNEVSYLRFFLTDVTAENVNAIFDNIKLERIE